MSQNVQNVPEFPKMSYSDESFVAGHDYDIQIPKYYVFWEPEKKTDPYIESCLN